jgi:hypothetical protein
MRLSSRIGVAITVAAAAALAAGVLTTIGAHTPATRSHTRLTASTLPTPSHIVIVIVMEENHSYSDIIGNTSQAPYMNDLAGEGALLTSSYAITHPSEPNYMALFAGSMTSAIWTSGSSSAATSRT